MFDDRAANASACSFPAQLDDNMAPAVLAPIVCAGKPPLRDSGLWRSVGFQKLITTLAVLALGYWVSESVPLTTCILVSEQPASPVAYPLSLGGSKSGDVGSLMAARFLSPVDVASIDSLYPRHRCSHFVCVVWRQHTAQTERSLQLCQR